MSGCFEFEARHKALAGITAFIKTKNYTENEVRFKIFKELVEERVQYVGLMVQYVGLMVQYVGLMVQYVGLMVQYVGLMVQYVGLMVQYVGLMVQNVGLMVGNKWQRCPCL
jgi:hypothetical protein